MPSGVDAIILCGGAGLRLRSVTGSSPKSLAHVGGRPFLDILLGQLKRHAFHSVILAVGYQNELIHSEFGDCAHGLTLRYSVESSPLGTGGALSMAGRLVESETVLIMNGDSYTDVNLLAFVSDFVATEAQVSVVVVPADGRTDCGMVAVDSQGRILGLREKASAPGAKYINAGLYLTSGTLLREISGEPPISLETDLFPQWLAQGKCVRAFVHPGTCVDIGTPERFHGAQGLLAKAELDDALTEEEGRESRT